MPRPIPTPVYHFTRIEHLSTIIRDGLLPDIDAQQRRVLQQEIGHREIKNRRRQRAVPCGNHGVVADYVPFYFATRSPMMCSIHHGNVDGVDRDTSKLVYLCTDTQTLHDAGLTVIYSDQNARIEMAQMTTDDSVLDDDSFIDWPLMRAQYWGNTDKDPNRKERRQAECLVHPRVDWDLIRAVGVKSRDKAEQVIEILAQAGVTTQIFVRPGWYF